jgi:glycogen synthase
VAGGDQVKTELRLFTALGPGDIVNARKKQLAGLAVNETSIAFSEQLFAYCRLHNIKTLAISSNSRLDRLEDENITMENRPKSFQNSGGLRFHLSLILYGIYLVIRAHRFRADIAIIDSGTSHYFVLTLFRVVGIPVVANLHNVLWPAGFPPTRFVHRVIRSLNRLFFRYAAAGAIGVSPECERQVQAESNHRIPFFQYRCQFRPEGFRHSPSYQGGIFRIVFVGRAEKNKGLLDIAQMAADLKVQAPVKVIFDVCGDGPALPELAELVERDHLSDVAIIHGRLEREALLKVYGEAHAAIVPTRSNFAEGMPQVCAEAVLSGLPVITSKVANAFDVIGVATIEAEVDNSDSYVSAILSLINTPALYTSLKSECARLALQFVDQQQGYSAAVHRMIEKLYPDAL